MANSQAENPLIVQGDHTVLVEVDSPRYDGGARRGWPGFAELIKSPEHIHTYRITPLSIWNACAVGDHRRRNRRNAPGVLEVSTCPSTWRSEIREFASRYGRLRLERDETGLGLSGARLAAGRGDRPQQARWRLCWPRG